MKTTVFRASSLSQMGLNIGSPSNLPKTKLSAESKYRGDGILDDLPVLVRSECYNAKDLLLRPVESPVELC